jgi:adenine-specific DNA-methyltransferase
MSPDQITPEILAQLEAKLLALLPADGSTIGNGTAAKEMAVGEAVYEHVKASLLAKGVIAKGQGRGGSIRRANVAKDEFFDPKEVTSVAPLNLNAPGGKAPKAPKTEAPAVPFTQHRHADATRKNLPPAGGDAQQEVGQEQKIVYAFDPHRSPELRFNGQIGRLKDLLVKATQEKLSTEEAAEFAKLIESEQPWLEWAGKRENPNFSVDPVALHIHERVSAEAILRAIRREDIQRDMFLTSQLSPREAKAYYKHDEAWTNRLILGDSLQVMTSLAKRENLAGKVQMIYIDPPYGIKFSSNWQNEVGRPDVKDKDEDLSREPEMIRAYRDTWLLGVHSYLHYLKQRILVSHELLAPTGSIFIQISDANVHRVRLILDEVFGAENFVSEIVLKTTAGAGSPTGGTLSLAAVHDYVLWYAKDKHQLSYNQLYFDKGDMQSADLYRRVIEASGEERNASPSEVSGESKLPAGGAFFMSDNITSQSSPESATFPISYKGIEVSPGKGGWKTNPEGMRRLKNASRLYLTKNRSLRYVRCLEDFNVAPINDVWVDVATGSFTAEKVYVVQTNLKIIQRCMLMATVPGDLVLDPTCGSGTTATVAEQWGRRWITIDTSRVAASIARQRLMTSTFEVYKAKDPVVGIDPTAPINPSYGFEYKTAPHITLKSIARNVGLDPIFERHEAILAQKLQAANEALAGVTDVLRATLVAKLATKFRADGARAITDADARRWLLPRTDKALLNFGTVSQKKDWVASIPPEPQWREWEVPFDTDADWPQALQEAVKAFREAWRAKMDEVNAAIAASAEQEELVDQPIVIKGVTRVTGPFTVESVRPPEISADPAKPDAADGSPIGGEPAGNLPTFEPEEERNLSAHVDRMLSLLKQDGITFLGNKHISLTRLDRADHPMIHGEGEYTPEGAAEPRKVAIVIGPEHGAVPLFFVEEAMRISYKRGYDDLVIAGFSFDAFAQECIQTNNEDKNSKLAMHMAQIRPDVTMKDLLKKTNKVEQIFTVFGQPRSRVEPAEGGEFRATLEGVDVYDPVANQIVSSGADKVAAWFLDTDYDGKVFCVCQAFFPDKSAWEKLQRALKATIAEEEWSKLTGKVSLPFKKGKTGLVAVKVIDPRGNEVMRIHRLA